MAAYRFAAARAAVVCSAYDGHVAELREEPAQLMRDEPQDAAAEARVGNIVPRLRRRRRRVHAGKMWINVERTPGM